MGTLRSPSDSHQSGAEAQAGVTPWHSSLAWKMLTLALSQLSPRGRQQHGPMGAAEPGFI